MHRVIILGNCVAARLQDMLAAHAGVREHFTLVPAPMIHGLTQEAQWAALAEEARTCHWIFTQPLFNFGPCNTDALRATLGPGQRLVTFSSPNFEAYFPDVLHAGAVRSPRFDPPLEWHSRIILTCYLGGMSMLQVEDFYLNHPLFRRASAERALRAAWSAYAVREEGVELGTLEMVRQAYAARPLFQTWRHPDDGLLRAMAGRMLETLGLQEDESMPVDGFGFNQWPIITRHHDLFQFPERAYFTVAGKRISIGDVAAGYYTFYDFHPAFVEQAKTALARVV